MIGVLTKTKPNFIETFESKIGANDEVCFTKFTRIFEYLND